MQKTDFIALFNICLAFVQLEEKRIEEIRIEKKRTCNYYFID